MFCCPITGSFLQYFRLLPFKYIMYPFLRVINNNPLHISCFNLVEPDDSVYMIRMTLEINDY